MKVYLVKYSCDGEAYAYRVLAASPDAAVALVAKEIDFDTSLLSFEDSLVPSDCRQGEAFNQ